MTGAVDRLIDLYREVVQRFPRCSFDPTRGQLAAAQYLRSHALTCKGRAAEVLAASAAKQESLEQTLTEGRLRHAIPGAWLWLAAAAGLTAALIDRSRRSQPAVTAAEPAIVEAIE